MALNFEKFAVLAIKIVDEIRSTNANPKKLDDENSAKPVESRINAFYRAIGLPSFRDNEPPDGLNEGNAFGENSDKSSEYPELKKRDRSFDTKLGESELKTFLDTSNSTILSSIKDAGKDNARLKGTLFPMVVDGDIKIYPQDRRVGGAFFKKDSELRHNKILYRRPLIELIVLLRLREEQFVNSKDKDKLQDSFDDLDDSFFDGIGENIITQEILKSLLNAVIDPNGIKKFVDATVKRLGKIRTNNSRINFGDTADKRPVNEQQQKLTDSSEISTKEEDIKNKRDAVARENNAKLTILEFDDSLGGEETKNMKDAMFAPMILDIMLSENEDIEKIVEEAEVRNKLPERELRTLHKRADLSLGTFSGLSGVDIVVVITALFSIDKRDLLGLLNPKSLGRLNILKDSTTLSSDAAAVDVAIENLQEKVKEIYKELSKKIDIHEISETKDSDKKADDGE